jgi:hypothetical protein
VVGTATVTMQLRGKNASKIIERLCFLRSPCRGVVLKAIGATVHWEFSCGVLTSEQRRDHGSWRISIAKIRYQLTSNEDIAEEQPLLRTVTK